MRVLALICLLISSLSAAEKPNFVYILADDLGWGDLGCYGQKTLTTPHLDQLAAEGIRFTRHYSGSTVCAPSRCVLMTGLHTGHCRVRGNGNALLKPEDVTLGELLQQAGYQTGCFGKWGIGHPPPLDDPNKNGFHQFYGYVNMHHAHNFYPEFLVRNGKREMLDNITKAIWKQEAGRQIGGPREGSGVAEVKVDYAPELIVKEAVSFINAQGKDPFFLYLALNTPHANNEGGRDEQQDGMEVPDYGEFADEDWPNPEKGFAAMIRDIDNTVAAIRKALSDNDIKNTLIVFTSDNGPHQEGRHQMEFFDSNGSLNGMKRDLTDGGIRVPMIAHWAGKIAPGTETDHLSGFQDVLPTFVEAAGAEVPGSLDGISFLPVLLGNPEGQKQHEYLYWEFNEKGGKIGVTTTDWKAIRRGTTKKGLDAELFLYDLKNDPAETTNVAADHPEIAGKMAKWMQQSHTPLE